MDSEVDSVGFYTTYSDISSESIVEKYLTVNLTLVGNPGVGKSSLIYAYLHDKFPRDALPESGSQYTVPFTTRVKLNGDRFEVRLWDSPGTFDVNSDPYQEADCFILCYSLSSRKSFEKLKTFWLPKLQKSYSDVPVITAGLKADRRKYSESIFETQLEALSSQSSATTRRILRCSAKTGVGVEYIFVQGIQSAAKTKITPLDCRAQYCSCLYL